MLHEFNGGDGAEPFADVLLLDDTLYGTTKLGSVFKVDTDGTDFQVLHTFGSIPNDGYESFGGLVFNGASLYGTTRYGGSGGGGAVFAIDRDGNNYRQVIHEFSGPDGTGSEAGLVLNGTTLYGTTAFGGANNDGTVFSVDTHGSNFDVLHEFLSPTDGGLLFGGLALKGTRLYGNTIQAASEGGAPCLGSARMVPILRFCTISLRAKARISGTDVAVSGTTLYGTTLNGGPANRGTVYSLETDGSGFQVLRRSSGPSRQVAAGRQREHWRENLWHGSHGG